MIDFFTFAYVLLHKFFFVCHDPNSFNDNVDMLDLFILLKILKNFLYLK